jgi:hypothetical protein
VLTATSCAAIFSVRVCHAGNCATTMSVSSIQRVGSTVCIAAFAAVATLGHGLHQLAGIQHGCPCRVESVVNDICDGHGCPLNVCVSRPRHITAVQVPRDACAICRVLAQPVQTGIALEVVVRFVPRIDVTVAFDDPAPKETYVCYIARGPPAVV